MYMILTGKLPFYAKDYDHLINKIKHSEIGYCISV